MWTRILIAVAVVALICFVGWLLYDNGKQAGRLEVQTKWDRAALEASEAVRKKEQELSAANQRINHELQQQKARNAALSRAHAQRLREYEDALDRATSTDPTTFTGTDGPFAVIAGECGRALIALDGHARDLATTAAALQQYAAGVCVTVPDRALKGSE